MSSENELDSSPATDSNETVQSGSAVKTANIADPVVAFGLAKSDRHFLILLSSLILALMILHLWRLSSQGTPALEVQRLPSRQSEFHIDINRASWVEWMQLPQIGETMARQIVADRDARGPFTSIEDVDRVRGIGKATMKKIRPFLKVQ